MGWGSRLKGAFKKAGENYGKASKGYGKAQGWARKHLPDLDELFETPDISGIFEDAPRRRKWKRKKR